MNKSYYSLFLSEELLLREELAGVLTISIKDVDLFRVREDLLTYGIGLPKSIVA